MRYPTRGGLIIPPVELNFPTPTPEQLNTRRATTIHHGYWEKRRYDIRHRAVFRSLITNVYPLLVDDHIRLHMDFDAPKQPHDSLMIEVVDDYLAVNGVVECIREKKTRTTYLIQPEEWQQIRNGYRGQDRMAG